MSWWRDQFRMWTHLQLLPALESGEETLIGGQAVMEGVMMRAPHSYCIAVRRADGSVVYETKPLAKVSEKYPIFKLPMLRGLGTLGQAMSLGIKSLQFSANIAMEDEAKAEAALKAAKTGSSVTMLAMNSLAPGAVCSTPAAGSGGSGASKPFSNAMMAGQLIFSLGFFVVAYKLVPLWIATWFAKLWPVLEGRIAFNLVDGIIRILIFLCFLTAMSRMKDIRRVFEYHGGEHRVVFNYESGKPVDVSTAQSFPTFHPRCGTSFLITVMLISMAVYTLLPFDGFAAKFASRIVLLPVIAGLSYEIIRFAAKRKEGVLMQLLAAPGLWLQRITTQPPDDQQTDIAIKALAGAMEEEQRQGGQLVIA